MIHYVKNAVLIINKFKENKLILSKLVREGAIKMDSLGTYVNMSSR